jgi:hypothetical protein
LAYVPGVREDDVTSPDVGIRQPLGVPLGDEIESGGLVQSETVKVLTTYHGHTGRDKGFDFDR